MTNRTSPTPPNRTSTVPVDPAIENYLRGLLGRTDTPILQDMESLAVQRSFPIVGRLVGVFLESLARSIGAESVFEFGSGYGYSAYWFARAVGSEGRIVCTDGDPLNRFQAEHFLKVAGLWERIDFHTGFAQDIFTRTHEPFDICYNDVDKGDYPEVWRLAKDRIRSGGLYIADNVLWHGRVAMDEYTDVVPGWTEAILEHNALIFGDPDFDAYINPIRDGVLVARKKTG
ncbi:O-methyltransferase [Methylomicrobium album]|uniref:Putative O-methyltransferase n=1 Tax=Methylomicrobium album BG8 TaxID=686340 RepID=H8GH71_METAL|nr:O-methyltransferase [Methylomicrobium album]EIC28862.1 putative O-methyltransferase [Methylomicrobium album BG8]